MHVLKKFGKCVLYIVITNNTNVGTTNDLSAEKNIDYIKFYWYTVIMCMGNKEFCNLTYPQKLIKVM